MHLSLRAGPRRRTRRAVLAAALAALALPAAADAATVAFIDNSNGGAVSYAGHPNEVNNVRVGFTAAGIVIDDQVSITTLSSECRITSAGDAICPGTASSVSVETRDENDTIRYTAPHRGSVDGGSGADTIFAGLRQAGLGREIEPVFYEGHGGIDDLAVDTVSYRSANSRVDVSLDEVGSGVSFGDGRPGDLEGIFTDIEVIEGSNFDDTLLGTNRNETFRGLNGNDVIGTGGGTDLIDEGSAPNGADTLDGGNGIGDRITYGTRTSGVSVSLDGVRNDGASGEQDDVRPSVEHVTGTNFADTLVGSSLANILDGRSGPDTILGQDNNDTILARDAFEDVVGCGSGFDTAQLDSRDAFGGCESTSVTAVGKLRLAPTTVKAEAGRPARLRLSWRHPVSWRKLRTVELRLVRDGAPVGEVTIRPSKRRISANGAVELIRTRLTGKGKTVTARLAVLLDHRLAGQTLTAEVQATDTRGRRQLEPDAGTILVAR
jgi:Ca2+-binding RTX toxin-like protein